MDFSTLPLPGEPLEFVETYFYYDGPKAFALKAKDLPIFYIVNTVDEDDDSITNLLVAVSPDRFKAIRSGTVTFREAFTENAASSMFVVRWDYSQQLERPIPEIRTLQSRLLPEGWLPAIGTRLDRETFTVEPYETAGIEQLARDYGRSFFAIKLRAQDSNISSFPAREAGQFLEAVHSGFNAIRRQIAGTRADAAELSPAVFDLRAASFVVVLTVDRKEALFEPSDAVEGIFETLADLIEVVGRSESELLLEALRKLPKRVRSSFKEMLEPASKVGSGVEFFGGVANSGRTFAASADAEAVESAVRAIESAPPTLVPISVRRGLLMGSIIRTGRFEIVDLADGRRYAGEMSPLAIEQANNLPVGDASFVNATVKAIVPFGAEDEQSPGTKFVLEEVSPSEAVGG